MKLFKVTRGMSIECIVKFDPYFNLMTTGLLPEGVPSKLERARLNSSLKGSSRALKGNSLVPNSILLSFEEGST